MPPRWHSAVTVCCGRASALQQTQQMLRKSQQCCGKVGMSQGHLKDLKDGRFTAASCSGEPANQLNLRLWEKSWAISSTRRWNGALRIRRSADFWYFLRRQRQLDAERFLQQLQHSPDDDLPQRDRANAEPVRPSSSNSADAGTRLARHPNAQHNPRGAAASGAICSLLRPAASTSAFKFASSEVHPAVSTIMHRRDRFISLQLAEDRGRLRQLTSPFPAAAHLAISLCGSSLQGCLSCTVRCCVRVT